MSNKRQSEMRGQENRLQNAGWEITRASRFNHGAEMLCHSVCKIVVGHYLTHEMGYNVSFEVNHPERGEADIVAWNQDDILCVECETDPKDEVISDKLDRYVKNGSPIREMFVLNPLEMPAEWMEVYKWVDEQLFQSLDG